MPTVICKVLKNKSNGQTYVNLPRKEGFQPGEHVQIQTVKIETKIIKL